MFFFFFFPLYILDCNADGDRVLLILQDEKPRPTPSPIQHNIVLDVSSVTFCSSSHVYLISSYMINYSEMIECTPLTILVWT